MCKRHPGTKSALCLVVSGLSGLLRSRLWPSFIPRRRCSSSGFSSPSSIPLSLLLVPSPSKLSRCCLHWSRAEWGDLAPLLYPRWRVVMHQISALCESPLSRHKLNLGLMRAGSPLCTGGGRGNDILILYTGFVVLEGCFCVFLSPLQKQDGRRCALPSLGAMLSLYI